MKPRSILLLVAAGLVVAGAVVAVVVATRPAPAPAPIAQTVTPPETAPTTKTPEPAQPKPKPQPQKRPAATAPAVSQPSAKVPATVAQTPQVTPLEPAPDPAVLRIDSPVTGTIYHSAVALTGSVVGPGKAAARTSAKSVAWSIAGTDRTGPISVAADGTFRVAISTAGLRDALNLIVTAAWKDGTATEASVTLADDGVGPGVRIGSPRSAESYGSIVTVKGTVSGPVGVSDPLSEVGDVAWAVAGSNLKGPLALARDGTFSFSVPTVGLQGDLGITVTATDRNGRPGSATVTLADRQTGPALRIEAPSDASSYAATVTVSGRVGDPSDPSGAPSEVKGLSWRVVGSASLAGDVAFQKDGSFRFSFPTDGLVGGQVLEFKAVDLNGRSSLRSLTLRAPEQPAAQAGQGEPPGLALTTPDDRSFYGASITVKGSATNTATDTGTDQVARVSWAMSGSPLSGAADVGTDGVFTFTVRTAGLSGTLALNVVATARSGLTTAKSIFLLDDTTGLPVTISAPGNGGYYRNATVIEGHVGDGSAAADLQSLSYQMTGKPVLTGRFAADASGAFKFALPFGQVTGDVTVKITAEDARGRLTNASILLHDGRLKPLVLVSAPAPGSFYGSLLRIAGTVSDPYAGQAGMSGIDSLGWLVAPVDYSRTSTPARGTALVGADGAFRFSVPTTGLAGPQDITVTATAKNGNKGELTVRVAQGDGDVPGFTIIPADRAITVTWNPAAFATRYDLSWASGGAAPEKGSTTTTASSPLVLSGLENGTRYALRMSVVFDDGGVGTSPLVNAIPLSPQTLAPTVQGDYQQVKLSWDRISGADSYDVWRSLAGSSAVTRIAADVRATTYTDSSIEFGKDYAYRIAPAGPLAPLSVPVIGRGLAFPSEKLAPLGKAAVKEVRRVTLSGGYAFVSGGANGVHIIDVSNPTKPLDVGTMQTDDAWDVAATSEYAYVADGESGLRVFDITAPRSPVLIGSRKTSNARGVALSGSLAVVADGDKGVKIIDVSDARTLNRLGVLETVNAADVVMSGAYALLADGAGGLKIIDISKPAAPIVIGSLPTTDARAVAVQAGLAAVADGTGGLRVVDVKDPRKPQLLATFATGTATGVALAEGFAFVTDGTTGIKVVDLSDPSHPSLFATHASPGAADVSVQDRVAFIAQETGLETMRVQIQGTSFRVASLETGGKAYAVSVTGEWAYVASHSQGVRVVSLSDPAHLSDGSLTGALATRFAVAVNVADKLAFVADGTSGVRIMDVSPSWDTKKPLPPVDIGAYRPGGSVNRVVPSGTYAYVAAGEQGVHVLDVSAPSNPVEVASVRTTNAQDIIVNGTWVYVADGDGGVKVLDVSVPAKPVIQPTVIRGNAKILALTGSTLLAGGRDGVSIIDVSDPSAPVVKGRYLTSYAESIAAAGSYLYVAEGFKGLTVVDIAHPARPIVVSSCEDVFAVGVAVKGDYAMVADSFGLRVIRVLIPDWLAH